MPNCPMRIIAADSRTARTLSRRRRGPHRARPWRCVRARCRSPRSRPGCAIPMRSMRKHVLGLQPLDPLDAATGPLERGTAIHRILELFMRETSRRTGRPMPKRGCSPLPSDVFRDAGIPHATLALWRPRFRKRGTLVRRTRTDAAPVHLRHPFSKSAAAWHSTAPGGDLRPARPRRPHRCAARQGGAAIIDYKTGKPPSAFASRSADRAAIAARRRDPRSAAALPRTSARSQLANCVYHPASPAVRRRARRLSMRDVENLRVRRRRTQARRARSRHSIARRRPIPPRHAVPKERPAITIISRACANGRCPAGRSSRMTAGMHACVRSAGSPPGCPPMPAPARRTHSPIA